MSGNIEHRLTSLEEKVQNLDLQVKRIMSQIESESGTMARAHSLINHEIGKIKLVLFGNGKPEEGLVTRFALMEDREKESQGAKKMYLTPFLTALFGGLVAYFLPRVFK